MLVNKNVNTLVILILDKQFLLSIPHVLYQVSLHDMAEPNGRI